MSDIGNVEEYINYLNFHGGTTEEGHFIRNVGEIVHDFLFFIHSRYSYMGPSLELLIRASPKNNAQARIDNKIIINRGIIDLFVPHEATTSEVKYTEFLSLSQEQRVQRLGGLLWVVAHEFFHFARGHHRVRATSKLMAQALEFDADCYAIAGTYRYFLDHMQAEQSRADIKNIVCKSFYFGIRELIEINDIKRDEEKSHPRWAVRLRAAHDKLANLDIPLVNFGLTQQFIDEYNILFDEMVKFERDFLVRNGVQSVKESKFLVGEYVDGVPSPEYSKLLAEWERIEPLVWSVSNLFADKFIHGKPFLVSGEGRTTCFSRGIQYTSESVNWWLRPMFHMQSSSSNMQVGYSARVIIPNAYWVPR